MALAASNVQQNEETKALFPGPLGLVFPLLSLPANYRMLVISAKHSQTGAEELQLFLFHLTQNNDAHATIKLTKNKSITSVLPITNALKEFHHIFDGKTKNQYYNQPLRQKMLKAFELFCRLCETPEKIAWIISRLCSTHSVRLLNIKSFENQFKQASFDKITMLRIQNETFMKSLHHVTELLYEKMLTTDKAIYIFLDEMKSNNTPNLHWRITDLEIKYHIEKVTQTHAHQLLNKAMFSSDSCPILVTKIKEVFDAFIKGAGDEEMACLEPQLGFIMRGFLPSFHPRQEIISFEVKNRILALHNYHFYMTALRKFADFLYVHFGSQIFSDPSNNEKK